MKIICEAKRLRDIFFLFNQLSQTGSEAVLSDDCHAFTGKRAYTDDYKMFMIFVLLQAEVSDMQQACFCFNGNTSENDHGCSDKVNLLLS